MEKHFFKCFYVSADIKETYKKLSTGKPCSTESGPSKTTPLPPCTSSSKTQQLSVERFLDQPLDKVGTHTFEKLLAEMVVSCDMSFRSVEDPRFLSFVKFLRPAIEVPSRYVLSSRIIPSAIKSAENEVRKDLEKHTNLTLSLDGFKNVRNQSILGKFSKIGSSGW